ncbi:DUF4305 domain-containing protein [Bacillus mangrovi]|uniref:DUF4305 domain-containing protein n=1 Tax=Metabacillus mangrovi TaxID=1491830 RepID=A0A7X2S9F4_9BACI|nr:YdiK family protein [Metabacillus mangrovi]MTH55571.1 DUF4305 domain-containing protein [Metabacillus mangrovi]
MKARPGTLAVFYLAMGALFTSLAINSSSDGMWNFLTVVMMVIATFDFAVAIRMFRFSLKQRSAQKK